MTLSPDSYSLLIGTDKEIIRFNFLSGEEDFRVQTECDQTHVLQNSKCGKLFASGSCDASVKVWEYQSRRNLKTFNGHSLMISCLDFSNDSRYLASGSFDGLVNIWDLTAGSHYFTINI